eukprot:CAMPEP_0171385128 /NCGR_PEP_ID=MMETSP0879-20121228/38827_1 /TAXON_ID=67004 /ORGANISM="Thalassiosira weissflogii, Strain CCMP1336" /LENGTH=36 /DNA_ID= /DNA_START= /DNA_END= /DNA_ORIENTATION=
MEVALSVVLKKRVQTALMNRNMGIDWGKMEKKMTDT